MTGIVVTGLYRYPVKSLRGHGVERTAVERIGLEGDRRWMVVESSGRMLTIRQVPEMTRIDVLPTAAGLVLSHADFGMCRIVTPAPQAGQRTVDIWCDKVPALVAEPAANDFLSQCLGRVVELVYLADTAARPVDPTYGAASDRVSFADGYPVHLTTLPSLADLNVRLGHAMDMRCFRPNIVVDGDIPWAEDEWKEIRIGSIGYRIVKPCGRCVITTRDPETGAAQSRGEPLKTLARFHKASDGAVVFGQNLIPDGAGTIAIGDRLEVLRTGRSNLLD